MVTNLNYLSVDCFFSGIPILQRYKAYGHIAINSHFLSYWIAVILRTVLTLFSSFSNKLLWYSIKQRNKKEAICCK